MAKRVFVDPPRGALLDTLARAERLILTLGSRTDGSIPATDRYDLLRMAHRLSSDLQRAGYTMPDPYYRSAAWRQLRAACLRRDPICRTPGCQEPSVAADHIIPRSKGGPDALSNLRGLCEHHHNQRRRGGEPRMKGCTADGTPLDPNHWWNTGR